jgi:hypothetical protein
MDSAGHGEKMRTSSSSASAIVYVGARELELSRFIGGELCLSPGRGRRLDLVTPPCPPEAATRGDHPFDVTVQYLVIYSVNTSA